jgi:hypothetical protein
MLLTCPAICHLTVHMHSEQSIVKPKGSIILIPKPATRHNSYFERSHHFIKKGKAIPVICHGGPLGCEVLRFPHFIDNRLTDGSETVNLRCQPPFNPRRFLVPISVRCWVNPRATVWLEGLGQLRNPMTSSGIKPATFRLVA